VREFTVGLWADEDPDTSTDLYLVVVDKFTELGGDRVERVRSTIVHGVEVRSNNYWGVRFYVPTLAVVFTGRCAGVHHLSVGL
jgi:hypothetical protein